MDAIDMFNVFLSIVALIGLGFLLFFSTSAGKRWIKNL